MIKLNIKTLFSILLFVAVTQSCKKLDIGVNQNNLTEKEILEKFTFIPQGQNPVLQKISDKIKRDNKEAHFITDLANRVGYPIWSATEIRKPKNNFANRTESDEEYEIVLFHFLNPILMK
ncbi:MAG: hypothetical protein KGZ59_01480 [Chitinophagaceae bacterium]|nr:hypothetical protein [Chitinophagaceae bacterium]